MELKIGLDLGSTAIKAVIVDGGRLLWRGARPTAPLQEALADDLIGRGLAEAGLPPDAPRRLASTGYGKALYRRADLRLDELTANARGLFSASSGRARAIINIGGQDLKTIRVSETGQIVDFRMNDKCAAGTGRFFELAARILDAPLEDFPALADSAAATVELSSTCVVFAESEMVSLVARGVDRGAIVKALHASVARRAAGLMGRVDGGEVWLDGGPAQNRGLAAALADELMAEVRVAPAPQFTVALGAALSL
jgi:predicted CoA-substrate-specific enzyme activase